MLTITPEASHAIRGILAASDAPDGSMFRISPQGQDGTGARARPGRVGDRRPPRPMTRSSRGRRSLICVEPSAAVHARGQAARGDQMVGDQVSFSIGEQRSGRTLDLLSRRFGQPVDSRAVGAGVSWAHGISADRRDHFGGSHCGGGAPGGGRGAAPPGDGARAHLSEGDRTRRRHPGRDPAARARGDHPARRAAQRALSLRRAGHPPVRLRRGPHPALGPTWRELDLAEIALARAADRRGLPILAICRGAQA